MMQHRRTLVALTLGSLAAIAACSRDLVAPRADNAIKPTASASAEKDLGDPTFLQPADGAPTIANPVIAFWAVKGRDQIVKMVYSSASRGGGLGDDGRRHGGGNGGGANGGSGHDSVVFAEFRVRAKSLVTRADGSPIADGDSILITMTLVDPNHGIIDFQPSGLRFSTKNPAQLKISYENANLDLNGDGVVDARDRLIQLTFHIGVRENPGDPFLPLPSAVDTELDEVETAILGFSGYAIEY
jgi:hypothetical protein